jgi:hypothetical protein
MVKTTKGGVAISERDQDGAIVMVRQGGNELVRMTIRLEGG